MISHRFFLVSLITIGLILLAFTTLITHVKAWNGNNPDFDVVNQISLYPVGAGISTQCTPNTGENWQCVQEEPYDGWDSLVYWTYNDEMTPNTDLYTLPGVYNCTRSISSVTVYAVSYEWSDSLPYSMTTYYLMIFTHGCYYNSSKVTGGFGTWGTMSYTFGVNNFTGKAWTWDEINSLQIGIIMYAGSAYCTQVFCVVQLTNDTCPLGMIAEWAWDNTSLPSGWQWCDGTNSTPDLRGRFVVGYNSSDTSNGYNVMNGTGGNNSVVWQLVAHTHTYTMPNTPVSRVHGVLSVSKWNQVESVATGTSTSGASGSTVAAGTSFDVRPSYFVLVYIEKVR
jgi:hypothetical protein